MVLMYKDLMQIFPNAKGVKDLDIEFHTVSLYSAFAQQRGLYIPFYKKDMDLKEAINQGAIGAVWDIDEAVPMYTPNHFPIFYTNDLLKGLEDMIELLRNKELEFEKDQVKTEFILLKDERNYTELRTYDIAVLQEQIEKNMIEQKKEGGE